MKVYPGLHAKVYNATMCCRTLDKLPWLWVRTSVISQKAVEYIHVLLQKKGCHSLL